MSKILSFFLLIAAPLASDGCFSSCECCSIEQSGYFRLKHREPGGIGYPKGYTSVGLFYTSSHCNLRYPFLDLRAHMDNDGKWASNLGLGIRKMAENCDVIVGGNFYWDWRQAKRSNFNKIGIGGEIFWPYWDLHINGYIPIGKMRKSTRKGFDRFEGHHAIMFKKYLLNMSGLDASIGYWLFKCDCASMHASLGGYYFRGNFNTDFGGAIAKAKLRFWNWIELEGQVSYDNKFKWIGQAELGISIPFGPTLKRYSRKTSCCKDLIALEQRLLEQPDRFEISVLASRKRKDKARHPLTNDLLTFYFVDNTSSSDGTFESPFPTISQAETASSNKDAIYVFPGSGPYDETITLKDLQLFGGSGAPFAVQTRFGSLNIPQLTKIKPSMVGSGEKVTLANKTRVTGMNITSDDTHAIHTASAIQGPIEIANNVLRASGFGGGVQIDDPFTGTANIYNNIVETEFLGITFFNTFSGVANIYNNSVEALGPISVLTGTGIFNVYDNSINADSDGIGFISSFVGTTNIFNNTINAVDDGINIVSEFTGTANIYNNSINVTGSFGIIIQGVFTGTTNIYDNEIFCDTNGFTTFAPFFGTANFYNNTIETAEDGIQFTLPFEGTANIYSNSITARLRSVFFLDDTIGTINIYDNILYCNTQCIEFSSTFSGSANIYNNSLTSGNNAGIRFESDVNLTDTLNIYNNLIFARLRGIQLGDVTGSVSIMNNQIKARDGQGIFMISMSSGNLILENNYSFSRNAALNSGFAPTLLEDVTLFMRNNAFVSGRFDEPTVSINSENVCAIIQNNLFDNRISENPISAAFVWTNISGISHLQFANNISTSRDPNDTEFSVTAGTLELESPNLQLSGLQAINEGVIDAPGVTFVPYE